MRYILNLEMEEHHAEKLLMERRGIIGLDVETVSLDNRNVLGVALAITGKTGYYFFNPRDDMLKEVIAQTPVVVAHNCKFDIPLLRKLGHTIHAYEDTKILAYSSGLLVNDLETLSKDILGRECPSVRELWGEKNQGNIGIDHVEMGRRSIIHACNAFALWEELPKPNLYYDIDKPVIEMLIEMEEWGVKIDQYELTKIEHETVMKLSTLKKELYEVLGEINFNSPTQVRKALQGIGVLGTRKTKTGMEAVSDKSLAPLNHPIANKIIQLRKLDKTISTYVTAFRNVDEKGRIYTKFSYARTGRFRSSDKEDE